MYVHNVIDKNTISETSGSIAIKFLIIGGLHKVFGPHRLGLSLSHSLTHG